jgi:hypothetical protein
MTSLNTTGTGNLEARFDSVNHQFRVASGISCWREKAARVRPPRRNCSAVWRRSVAAARCCYRVIPLTFMHPAYRNVGSCGKRTPLTAYYGR